MLNIKNTLDGFLKGVEIKGNTVQDAENLAAIRSVGDKVEGQELYEIPVLSCGKNLFNPLAHLRKATLQTDGYYLMETSTTSGSFATIRLKPNTTYTYSYMANAKNISNGTKVGITIVKQDGSNLFSPSTQYKPTDGFTKGVFTTDNDINYYISLHPNNGDSNVIYKIKDIQLEEGTQATPYEPYQEDKLTILSPVQLEKVGDVADRIICKDGVWGVEKNINTHIFNEVKHWTYEKISNEDFVKLKTSLAEAKHKKNAIVCDKFINQSFSNQECIYNMYYNGYNIELYLNKSRLSSDSVLESFGNWLTDNSIVVKYATEQPQFIPLPHDQQVKLRTFAGQTNIHFETEIEGAIKAQVPKSLGATVNTHTEQIGNLSKELDRVKKLEESTVSTVTTESDFTTVEETSNGYFEDVKVEGKTLVNLFGNGSYKHHATVKYHCLGKSLFELEVGKTYTALIKTNNRFDVKQQELIIKTVSADSIFTFKASRNLKLELITIDVDVDYDVNILLLEGDHTQNPPSYFEGLKSVGQDVEEVSVESINENLFDISELTILGNTERNKVVGDKIILNRTDNMKYEGVLFDISHLKNDKYYIYFEKEANTGVEFLKEDNEKLVWISSNSCVFEKTSSVTRIGFSSSVNMPNVLSNISLIKSELPKECVSRKQDKKRILYYNNETQTWEKPILREWDSIEKHSDGKYYYHKRSGEVVLNGSESWWKDSSIGANTTRYGTKIQNAQNTNTSNKLVCNLFACSGVTTYGTDVEDTQISDNSLYVRINTSKAQDVEGFKAWLQANPTTVVYQLAEEKVYECTNIDLITYDGETNYIVNSGAISPKSTLKVHNNISNVVKILQEKVSLLESNVKASQEVQDMMILETDMRMLDIELALMEHMPMTLNLGGSNMLRSATYFNFLKNHIINETYEKEYLENVMNKYLATGRINQDEYDELYKMLYPPVYDIELPIEY